jgi:DNA-binding response OmpR family regulator
VSRKRGGADQSIWSAWRGNARERHGWRNVSSVAFQASSYSVTGFKNPCYAANPERLLLRLFVRHAGKVLTHRHILREVWGPGSEDNTHYLRVYVARLREKLESSPMSPELILTEPGVGYRFAAPTS